MLMHMNETNPFGADQLRASVRFPIRLPIWLKTDQGEVKGETENISASGLSFLVERQLEENARIEFTIAMPGSVMGSIQKPSSGRCRTACNTSACVW